MTRDRPILLFGGGGQIGWQLRRALQPHGAGVVAPGSSELDLVDHEGLRRAMREVRPGLVINAAAFTDVRAAEREQILCWGINAEAPGIVAEEAAALGIPMIQFSTDFVFDGATDRPYREEDLPNPLNEYGRAKWQGELNVLAAHPAATVIRIGWVYGWRRRNFLLSIFRGLLAGKALSVVTDEVGTPSWDRHIAEMVSSIAGTLMIRGAQHETGGVFHVAPAGSASRWEFANVIAAATARLMNVEPGSIRPTVVADLEGEPARPRYSVLSTQRSSGVFGLATAPWEEQLELAFDELREIGSAYPRS